MGGIHPHKWSSFRKTKSKSWHNKKINSPSNWLTPSSLGIEEPITFINWFHLSLNASDAPSLAHKLFRLNCSLSYWWLLRKPLLRNRVGPVWWWSCIKCSSIGVANFKRFWRRRIMWNIMWVGTEESEKELKDSFIDFPQI